MQSDLINLLEQFRKTKSENAYFALLHLPDEDIPDLIQGFQDEKDTAVQAALVEIIGQRRLPDVLEFLSTALQHPSSQVWKNALDAFVTQGGSLNLLQKEKQRLSQLKPVSSDRMAWIEEAIQQIKQTIE